MLVLVLAVLPVASHSAVLALVLMLSPQAAAMFVYAWAMRRHGGLLRLPDVALGRRMIGYGLRAYVVTLLAFLLLRVDLLLVNGIQGSRAAGQYSIAVALADGLYLLPVSVSVNMFARVARGAERELSLRVFHLIAFAYLPICAVAAALASPVVALLFGPAYEPSVSLFLWLLPGVYCLGVFNVIAYHFAGHGMPKELVLVWIPGLVVNLGLDLMLLPHHGTYVASIASSVAYATVLVLHLRMFARWLGGWSVLRPSVSGIVSELRLALRRS
jgi:O-antigen/teichoic acid export membrane protein